MMEMKDLTHFSLFTGIGGFDLAAEWAGFRTIGQVEKDKYCQKVLRKHWPDVPLWEDIRDVTEETTTQSATLITCGFPCQSFSVAGNRRGKADDRYLWPEMFRIIQIIRPTWVLAENVTGIVKMALDDVLSDLESEGYSTQTFIIPACATNAPHRRDRVWVVAYCGQFPRGAEHQELAGGEARTPARGGSSIITNPKGTECQSTGSTRSGGARLADGGTYVANPKEQSKREQTDEENAFAGDREAWQEPSSGDWWESEPDVGRVAHGIPSRVDRLKCLGNAIVPQVAYQILKVIANIERNHSA